jgi:hypothetical protein
MTDYPPPPPGAPPPPPPPPYGAPPPPPPPGPPTEPPTQPYRLRTRDKVIAGSIGGLVLAGIIAAGVAGGGDEDETSTADETTTTAESDEDETTEPETTEAPTTTEEPTTTTARELTIGAGVYAVPAEFAPGTYRVAGYWARLDAAQEIIDNDLVSQDASEGMSLLDVQPTDAYVEISGAAVALADLPKVDPIQFGRVQGTYLVGPDIAPGQYRITPDETSGNAYWARIDQAHEIIDNNIAEGQLIVVVQPGDYALSFTGAIEVMP